MPKLTKEQQRLLLWLFKPSSFVEVTTNHKLHNALYNGLHNYRDDKGSRYKFDIRTLRALEINDLVSSQVVYYCGLAWVRFTISDAGRNFVSTFAAS